MCLERSFRILFLPLAMATAVSVHAQTASERQTLIELYDATNGADWYRNTGWLSATDHCTWTGVECASGLVREIRLSSNNLTGSLPSSVFELPQLQDLDLADNNLTGTLPQGAINGLPQFDNGDDAAVFIDLSGNGLTGSFPAFSRDDGPGDRVSIDLSDNRLTGPLPASWSAMRLNTLDLSDNDLGMAFANAWAALPTAFEISVAGTELTGPIPDEPARFEGDDALLPRLERLNLGRNGLTGALPAWFADLTLQRLSLHHNQLVGSIDRAIAAMSREGEVTLSLAHNGFSGTIPTDLSQLSIPRLDALTSTPGPRPGLDLCWNALEAPSPSLLEFIDPRHQGGRYADCQQERVTIDPQFSGSRYDPARSGEGFVQQVLDNGNTLLFWFTYPVREAGMTVQAQQAWFLGVTPSLDKSLWLRTLLQPGGSFGSGSDGFERPTFWLSINALEGQEQHVSYSREYTASRSLGGIPQYALMPLRHRQVALTRLAGTRCDNQQPHQWISGAWYDPQRSGEGFVVEVTESGSVVVYWFTYEPNDSGRQAWMIGTGVYVEGQVVIDEMIQPVGTMFGTDFDSGEIEHVDWGSLTLTFESQDAAQVAYQSHIAAYGSGGYPLARLARPRLADCD
jgi:hypothetical protein